MADYISKYKGPEFEEGLRRVLITDTESMAWIGRAMTKTEFDSFHEIGNWKIHINSYTTEQPNPYDTNVSIFESVVDKTTFLHRVFFNCGDDVMKLYTWDNTASVWNLELDKGMGGPITTVGSTSTIPEKDSNPEYKFLLYQNGDETILYAKDSTGNWYPVTKEDTMKTSVYDPKKIKKPPLTYLQEKHIDPDTTTPKMLNVHIPDTNIHMTEAERTQWVNALTKVALQEYLTEMKEYAKVKHNEIVQAAGPGMDATVEKVTATDNALQYHIANKTADGTATRTDKIHITATERTFFNAKAPGDHSHAAVDHRVKGDAAIVTTGVFDVARLPRECFTKIRMVVSRDAMFNYTPANDVVVGDVFHITPPAPGKEEWFRVKDITKLTTLDGYYDFTVQEGGMSADWSAITNPPDTVEKLGTTDLYTKTEVDTKSTEVYDGTINTAIMDPKGTYWKGMYNATTGWWLHQNSNYIRGYSETGNTDLSIQSYRNNGLSYPSIYRVLDRLSEMRYMRSRNTENPINQFTYGTAFKGYNYKSQSTPHFQQLNPYQMYYPFISHIKMRNPYYRIESYYGHDTVIGFNRSESLIYYTKVHDGVIHLFNLKAFCDALPSTLTVQDFSGVEVSFDTVKLKDACVMPDRGVWNIATIGSIGLYSRDDTAVNTPDTFEGLDYGGIVIVFEAATIVIPFNDRGILDPSMVAFLSNAFSSGLGTGEEIRLLPQTRLDCVAVPSYSYKERKNRNILKGSYPRQYLMHYMVWRTAPGEVIGVYNIQAYLERAPKTFPDRHYSIRCRSGKGLVTVGIREVMLKDIIVDGTRCMVYGGILKNGIDAYIDPPEIALGTTGENHSSAQNNCLWNLDSGNWMNLGSYVPVKSSGHEGGFGLSSKAIALYDSRTTQNEKDGVNKVVLYGKVLQMCPMSITENSYHSAELLMVTDGNKDDRNPTKWTYYVVPINQLLNDFRSRAKNRAVSIPCPNYTASIKWPDDSLKIETGGILSWHTLDASLSDIYYFEYTNGRYLLIVGTQFNGPDERHLEYGGTAYARANTITDALEESEIVILESYDDCQSFEVVKVMPKYPPMDLMAFRNTYRIFDKTPVFENTTLTGNDNVGITSQLAVIVQDEVVYIYNMQDADTLSNPRIVSLNTMNDTQIDEIEETLSAYPYDVASKNWNPIIKDGVFYRQYLYYEDDKIHYRESVDGISWERKFMEFINTPANSPAPYIQDRMLQFQSTALTNNMQFRDIKIDGAPNTIHFDKFGRNPLNPYSETYSTGGIPNPISSGMVRVKSKLPIYYVYNDRDYTLFVMNGSYNTPIVLGYKKGWNFGEPGWMRLIVDSDDESVMFHGLRPGAITKIVRNDSFIQNTYTMCTSFSIYSRDKQASDFNTGIWKNQLQMVETLIVGSSTTGPEFEMGTMDADALIMCGGTPLPAGTIRKTSRVAINGIDGSIEDGYDYSQFFSGIVNSLKTTQLYGFNHEDVFEIVKGSISVVLQGFDIIQTLPVAIPKTAAAPLRHDYVARENYSVLSKLITLLEAHITANGMTLPPTGSLGNITTFYVYTNSNERWSQDQLQFIDSSSSGVNTTWTYWYYETIYIVFHMMWDSAVTTSNMNGTTFQLKIPVPMPDLTVKTTDDATVGVDLYSETDHTTSFAAQLIKNAVLEPLDSIVNGASIAMNQHTNQFSVEDTGIRSFVQRLNDSMSVPNPRGEQNLWIDGLDKNSMSFFTEVPTDSKFIRLDELPTGIGFGLDNYADPIPLKDSSRVTHPIMRGTSYRARNAHQYLGLPESVKDAVKISPLQFRNATMNLSAAQTITDQYTGYTVLGTNQAVVAKTFTGMCAYLYRFNIAYKDEAMSQLKNTEDSIEALTDLLSKGLEVFTN